MKNNINNVIMDEREIMNNDKALAGGCVVSFLFSVGLLIFGLLKDNFTITVIGVIQILLMSFTILIIQYKKDSLALPKTIGGKTISTEMNSKGKLNRIGYCIVESLVFAIGFTIIDLLDTKKFVVPDMVIQFIVLLVVSFIFEYIYTNHTVKKYNKLMAEIDYDDEDNEE